MIASKFYGVNLHRLINKIVKNRDEQILALRIAIETIDSSLDSKEKESFQNQTLRPILKQQNVLFLTLFGNHIQTFKIPFAQMSDEQQSQCIANTLAQNQPFKNTMIGVVVGWFTDAESKVYCQNRTAFNKRIVQMLIQRLQDQRSFI
jgi:hypothetical protein